MSRYADQVVDQYGAPIVGASVYVYNQAGTALATLTADNSAPLANPVTSDQYGNYYFNTADGLYILRYHYGGIERWVKEYAQVGNGPSLPAEILAALSQPSGASIIGTADGGTVQDIMPVTVMGSSGSFRRSLYGIWAGTSTQAPSDNAVVVAGNDYTDITGLTDNIHTFCTVGLVTYTSTVSAGADYDTSLIYGGTGAWQHHNHFQLGTTFKDSVHFADVLGLGGNITIKDTAVVDKLIFVDVDKPTLEGSGSYGQITGLRYINAFFASDMANISSVTTNLAFEVRRYSTDPATAYAASSVSEGQMTCKSFSASDNESSPYNTNGTLNTNLERFNCRVGAGENGYMKWSNGSNTWLVGQVADSIDFRIRTTSGAAGGIDIANAGHVTPSAANSADMGDGTLTWRGVHVGTGFYFGATKVVGAQGAAVADATDAGSAITQLNLLLARCRAHGLIAT